MYKLYLLALIFIINFSTVSSQSSWQWQNPQPQGNNLNSVTFINSSTGYSAGDAGMIMMTTDAGVSWGILKSGTYYRLNSVDFADQMNTGYAVGYNGTILKTTNAGLTWLDRSLHADEVYLSVNFPADDQTGYLTGLSTSDTIGFIYKTVNGGVNWTLLNAGLNGVFNETEFPENAVTGYVCGRDYNNVNPLILKTTNGGDSWMNQSQELTGAFYSMSFPQNSQVGYVTGYPGKIYKTTNGGTNWVSQLSGSSAQFYSIEFPENEQTGVVVGTFGNYMRTSNGGVSWTSYSVPDPNNNFMYSVSFSNANTGIAAGMIGSLLRTTDAGISWTSIRKGPNKWTESVCFPLNSQTGWVCGSGLIMKTTNGGAEWIPQSADGNTVMFREILFPFDNETGYAVGGTGRIFKTIDGGQNWVRQIVVGVGAELLDIDFPVNASTGFISGDRVILKTTNGGDNWEQLNSPSIFLNAISFPADNETGYVCGESGSSGRIYKTTNGGVNWIQQTTGTVSGIVDIQFPVDELNGYAAEWAGKILRTTNGGVNWNAYQSDVYTYGICFPSNNITGYVTGGSYGASYLLKTTNGGVIWNKMNIPYNNQTTSVCFPENYDTGYVVGVTGAILKTVDGGGFIAVNSYSEIIPEKFYLSQNYPNPFNPVTNLEFGVSDFGFVSLKVFDVLGKEVRTLVNESRAAGFYKIEFDGSNLASGVYFYRLVVSLSNPMSKGEFTSVKKMLMLK